MERMTELALCRMGGTAPGEAGESREPHREASLWASQDEKACIVGTRFVEGRFKNEGPEGLIGRTVTVSNRFRTEDESKPDAQDVTFTWDKAGRRATSSTRSNRV